HDHHHHSVHAGWVGGIRRWVSSDDRQRAVPDEGRGSPGGVHLPPEARCCAGTNYRPGGCGHPRVRQPSAPNWQRGLSKETSMKRFQDRVALVTGGTSGIGKGTALAFAAEGARVVVAGRRETEGTAVVTDIRRHGGQATFVATDVTRDAD